MSAVGDVTVNGSAVDDLRQAGGHIILPARHFKSGENMIAMNFETGVAAANRPIIRYQDRDDGGEYVYTLFVPMEMASMSRGVPTPVRVIVATVSPVLLSMA